MLNLRLISLILLLPLFGFSQKNFINGYVIDLQKDTIFGQINYQDKLITPQFIEFKKGEQTTKYYPNEILGFGFDIIPKEFFTSEIVKIDKSPYELFALQVPDPVENRESFIKTDTIFLKVLVKGNLDLYYHKDEDNKPHFFIKRDQQDFTELIQEKKLVRKEDGSGTFIKTKELYKGQLNFELNDCLKSYSIIEGLEFEIESILKAVVGYNQCSNQLDYEFGDDGIKAKSNFFIFGGINNMSPKFKDESRPDLRESDFGTNFSPTLGIRHEFIPKNNLGKMTLITDLLYNPYNLTGYHEIRNSDEFYTMTNHKIQTSTIALKNAIRFNFLKEKSKIFYDFGILNVINIINKNDKEIMSTILAEDFYRETSIEEMNTHEIGVHSGFGIVFNRLSAEIRYSYSTSAISYSDLAHLHTFGLLVGYRINSPFDQTNSN